MALHSEAKNALDKYAEAKVGGGAYDRFQYTPSQRDMAPKAFAALDAILVACSSSEFNAAKGGTGRPAMVSVSGLRAIIARELG